MIADRRFPRSRAASGMLCCIVLWVGSIAWGEPTTVAPPPAGKPVASQPVAKRPGSSQTWEKDIAAFEAADRRSPPPKHPVLFVGSSGIRRWKTLAEDFPNVPVLNRGFGGSHIADSVYYAERIIIPYAPRLLVFRAGTNDIQAGKTPQQVCADFQALVTRVRAKLPEMPILFLSLNPSPAREKNLPRERQANALIAAFIQTQKNITYVDISTPMLGPDGKARPELYGPDRLHNSPAGYKLWTEILSRCPAFAQAAQSPSTPAP